MKEFERQVLTNKAAVLRRALYGLAVNAREEDVSELNAIISEMTVSRQKIWDTTSKKLRETFIHYSLVSSVHI